MHPSEKRPARPRAKPYLRSIFVICRCCSGPTVTRLSAAAASANVVYGDLTVKRSTQPGSALQLPPLEPSFDGSNGDQRSMLVDRVLSSNQFKASLRLCEFLLYIADCALRDAPEAATEQQIGVHVFHRVPGYNSSEDSIVRTHARILRQKLTEYFSTDGAAEPMIIEVPKGHYLPVFRARHSQALPAPFPLPAEVLPAAAVPPDNRRSSLWKALPVGMALGILSVLVLALAVFLIPRAWPKPPREATLDPFWAPFLSGDPPLVIYSNTRFTGDSRSGLHYLEPGGAPDPDQVVDHYTGIGELASVYELTRLFDSHHATFVLKRSLLVTWDEAKLRNLIFIGSPAENPSLNTVRLPDDFTMVTAPGYSGFANRHPLPGEPALYSRVEHPLNKDFALIALMPGVQPGKRTLIFAGLNTLGTQAAVEYACRRENMAELLKKVSSPNGELRPFEALLEVTLGGGVPLQSHLVALRVH